MDCAENIQSLNSVVGKVLTAISITAGSNEAPLQNVVCIINGMLRKMKTDEQKYSLKWDALLFHLFDDGQSVVSEYDLFVSGQSKGDI